MIDGSKITTGDNLMSHIDLFISAQIDVMQDLRYGSGKLNYVYMWLVLINICHKDILRHQITITPMVIPPSFILVPVVNCSYVQSIIVLSKWLLEESSKHISYFH